MNEREVHGDNHRAETPPSGFEWPAKDMVIARQDKSQGMIVNWERLAYR